MKVNLRTTNILQVKQAVMNDSMLKQLSKIENYETIDSWVDNNVNTLADVKGVLKRLIKIIVFLLRHFKIFE